MAISLAKGYAHFSVQVFHPAIVVEQGEHSDSKSLEYFWYCNLYSFYSINHVSCVSLKQIPVQKARIDYDDPKD